MEDTDLWLVGFINEAAFSYTLHSIPGSHAGSVFKIQICILKGLTISLHLQCYRSSPTPLHSHLDYCRHLVLLLPASLPSILIEPSSQGDPFKI